MGIFDKAKEVEQEVVAEVKVVEAEVVAEVKAIEAEVKSKADGAVKWFKTVLGYPLHDPTPENNKQISNTDPTPAVHTEWVQTQIDAGLVKEVSDPADVAAAAAVAAAAPSPAAAPAPAA